MTMPQDPTAAGGAAIDQANAALSSGDLAAFQEAIRQFNLTYANQVGQLYGQNFGPGQSAPPLASTLPAGQAIGSVGYIPGETGIGASQTIQGLQANEALAQQNANNTGFYNTPTQSAYTPGTFVNIDPNTYPAQYGQQMDYVLPSGQLQRVSTTQAKAMGWNGQFTATIPFTTAQGLEAAPPSSAPQQTLQGQTTYANLNAAAQNQALQAANVTGMYTQPGQVTPPGTNWGGQSFTSLPAATQQAYYQAHGGDWNAAMQAWVTDSNSAMNQAAVAAGGQAHDPSQPLPNSAAAVETQQAQQQYFNQAQALAQMFGTGYTPGTPGSPNATATSQETLAAQQQYANQANQLATLYGTYFSPLGPGQTGQTGVNMPGVGQMTTAYQNQLAQQALSAMNIEASAQNDPFRQLEVQYGAGAAGLQGLGSNNNGAQSIQRFSAPTGSAQGTGVLGQSQQFLNSLGGLYSNPSGGTQSVGSSNSPMFNANFTDPNAANYGGGQTQGMTGSGATGSQSSTGGNSTAQNIYNQYKSPNSVIARNYIQAPQGTQNMITSAISANTGLSQSDVDSQIKSQLPVQGGPSFGLAQI